jgi:hypothetical protein
VRLAVDVLGDAKAARDLYQPLKGRLVAVLSADGWAPTEEQLRQAIYDIQRKRGQGHSR